jgi:hypothetical protein
MSTTFTLPSPRRRSGVWRQWLGAALRSLRHDDAPALDAHLADAAAVRALADSCRTSDPGFASDLYAAADRHEIAHEVPSALTAR